MATDLVLFVGEKFDLGFAKVMGIRLLKPSELGKAREGLRVFVAESDDDVRKVIESKKADIALIEPKRRRDFMRQRASCLNHVLCKLAYKNGVAIAFSFSSVLKSGERHILLGRMMQNIRLCRKYRVRMVLASFAEEKWEMRGYDDLVSFAKTIGMTPKEAADSFNVVEEIIKEKESYIREGVRKA